MHPTTDWNYGLEIDEANLEGGIRFDEQPTNDRPFSPEGAPMKATVKGRRLPGYGLKNGWAAELPDAGRAPVKPEEKLTDLTLIPYGCTNLRITEFPLLK